MLKILREFFKYEAAGGLILVAAAAGALVLANSPWAGFYEQFLAVPGVVRVGSVEIAKPLLLWVNDGLMAVFFFLVGLEIKRELLEGQLSSRAQLVLPGLAGLAGMAVPAAIYTFVNRGDPALLAGWAIPSATDIAFALAVLALMRVPVSLKILLTAIAILDDLGSVAIIALFYTDQISALALGLAVTATAALALLNRSGVTATAPYAVVGALLWVCVLKSGVHATLAGVVAAAFIPLRDPAGGVSPLRRVEHGIHPWVAYGILPLFGFANAGISFAGITWASLLEPVTLGIAAGLFLGKQAGVLGAVWLAVRLRLAEMPKGANWGQVWGLACLCGIGFTMSLFIGSLAFEHAHFEAPIRLGVLAGSLASALLGALLLKLSAPRPVSASPSGRG